MERTNLSRRAFLTVGALVATTSSVEAMMNMVGVRGTREAAAGKVCRCHETPTWATVGNVSFRPYEPGRGYLPGDMVSHGNEYYVSSNNQVCEPGICKFWYKMHVNHPITIKAMEYMLDRRGCINITFEVEK